VLTLNSFQGFELKMKKIICANKFWPKYYSIWNSGCMRGHPWHDDTFLVFHRSALMVVSGHSLMCKTCWWCDGHMGLQFQGQGHNCLSNVMIVSVFLFAYFCHSWMDCEIIMHRYAVIKTKFSYVHTWMPKVIIFFL
jgi:hypothetical protein